MASFSSRSFAMYSKFGANFPFDAITDPSEIFQINISILLQLA